ncbi:DeoR/GlpR transcriptional regulator [Treponema phagedenis]|uniref:DeoR/GlpR transcriptional regulator n=1 Tax=Treponema phagedenis TaxID=162 RepID=A0A0B7GS18_TREPH|nr:DeoR/GlpR family DNA-binding transcription regulator [Treponema phagedenis]EFW37341.1 transcriptional regulator, DeoR family [Treponema phagedenis F0421]NVP24350.1 DeoR/GlpR transcriptional regulator [Treponema phagedenis]QEJ96044.1 DeoR/GlpR transcriptional regulator [Treponema phagedenis]QEJ99056.1 DeoR/GlpR transcriptional regulator [Treponema phagedenis]QEK01807.1 DeoR/GlpR transcriptional regulator [Treponema phagedenis]
MLAEERFDKILSLIDVKGSVTVQELAEKLHFSESTIRRDLNSLHSQGRLTKVFGGAITKDLTFSTKDVSVSSRETHNQSEKLEIARYAASLIQQDDFVYLDAGTTTGCMIDFISQKNITFVTNSFSHAERLSERGFRTYILGGEIKQTSEAVVGEEAIESLLKYNFTKGFWGTNGVSPNTGFSTPDISEALIKKAAMKRTHKRYVICDASKFSKLASVTFADFMKATVITSTLPDSSYSEYRNIIEVG